MDRYKSFEPGDLVIHRTAEVHPCLILSVQFISTKINGPQLELEILDPGNLKTRFVLAKYWKIYGT
jgi:hypothetical protein